MITCDEEIRCYSTRTSSFYFDDNFRRIALWVSALKICMHLHAHMMVCYTLGIDTRAMYVYHAIKVFAWSERFETFMFSAVYIM